VRPAIRSDNSLRPRQFEVFLLIQQGLTNQQIAGKLFLALGTVKGYTHAICRALGVKNRRQLIERYGGIPCCPTCGRPRVDSEVAPPLD